MLAKRHQISFEFRPDLLLACRLHAGVFEQLELRSVRFEALRCDRKSPFFGPGTDDTERFAWRA